MEITLNLDFFWQLVRNPYFPMVRQIFIYLIWFLVIFLVIRAFWRFRLVRLQRNFWAQQEYVLLAIDVPRENEQGPEVVEKMFAHLAGIKDEPDWWDKITVSKMQLNISMELISIEGRIQFLIYTPVKFRDLVEAAVYAAYSDAEIKAIDDYAQNISPEDLREDYDLWGAELVLYNNNPYPIRTYPAFEHPLTKDLKDPMVDLLEVLSKLQKDEQVWMQFVIMPIGSELRDEGMHLVKKLMGEKVPIVKTHLERLTDLPVNVLQKLSDLILPTVAELNVKPERAPALSPGEKDAIEAIQKKIAKLAFATKIRLIYVAKKDVFNKIKGVVSVLGAINTINTLDMNGLKPDKRTKTSQKKIETSGSLIFKKEAMLAAYKYRALGWLYTRGLIKSFQRLFYLFFNPKIVFTKLSILNIEELATLYHFPIALSVKAPLIKKTGFKRGEPPLGLPTLD